MRQGTFQWMKSVNKSIILNKIRREGPISRAQIAKETNLTPPTVSSNVKELIEQKIVKESQLGESQGGRKPTMLLINNDAFTIIGVDAGPENIKCILTDLSGKLINKTSNKLDKPSTNDSFLAVLKKTIRECIEGAPGKKKVIGIGVAMHGVVDTDKGVSLLAPSIGLTNIPIKEELEKTFELKVKVENDARAMALGEYWFGDHEEVKSMLVVNIGRGVGAGLIFDGKLYHGSSDIAGEVGHMIIDVNGEVCECGNRGCLQTFATGPSIVRRVKKERPAITLTAEEIYKSALKGNEEYSAIIKETGRFIGIGLVNLIHIMNPEKIVLGGGVSRAEQLVLPEIVKTIETSALTPLARRTKVTVTELGDEATLKGAVSLLLVDLFELN